MLKELLTLAAVSGLGEARYKLPDKISAVWFANWAQYRQSPYTFTPDSLGNILDDLDIFYYGFAYFCPNSSMYQPYWVTELNYCEGKNAFDIIPIEPKDTDFYSEIAAKKSSSNFKFVLSMGGWNFPSNFFSQMVSDSSSRAAFISSAKSFLSQYEFDGIDIDWEYPGSGARSDPVEISCDEFKTVNDTGGSSDPSVDKANFVTFMKELRAGLGDDAVITFCGQAGVSHVESGFDLKGLLQYVDLINVMTYDYTVSDTSSKQASLYTAPNEPLYAPTKGGSNIAQWNVNDTLTGYLKLGASADKLLVGIAYYGHTWMVESAGSNSDAWGHYGVVSALEASNCCGPTANTYGGTHGEYCEQCGEYSYYEIQNANCPNVYDDETATYIAYCSEQGSDSYTPANTWITYQGINTVKAITSFCNKLGCRGAFGFDITLDSYDNGWTFDLTTTMSDCVHNGC